MSTYKAQYGRLDSDAEVAMYSFDRPSNILWGAIAETLRERGWSDIEIAEWLSSKGPRWSLDGDLGEALDQLGRSFALKLEK